MPRNPKTAAPGADTIRLLSGLDESIGFLIADAGRGVKRSLYVRIGEYGIRGGSWFVLRALWAMDGVTQRELSQRLGLMEPSVLEMVRAMEKDGLVRRERDLIDRRKMRIILTQHARDLEPQLMAIAEEVNGIMLSRLSTRDVETLDRLLRRVRNTLRDDFDHISSIVGGKAKRMASGLDRQSDAMVPTDEATKPARPVLVRAVRRAGRT